VKCLFGKFVSSRIIREPHHVDLGEREKTVRFRVEKKEADIQGKRRFIRTADNVHLTSKLDKWDLRDL